MLIRIFSVLKTPFYSFLLIIVFISICNSQINICNDNQARRCKNIVSGNKITTELWNFGSISSPNNHTTDIVWNKLGYGYEFGMFVCAEVEVPPQSHPDAYIKIDDNGNPVINTDGDTVWVARVISDGLVSLGGEVSPDGTEHWGWKPMFGNGDGSSIWIRSVKICHLPMISIAMVMASLIAGLKVGITPI